MIKQRNRFHGHSSLRMVFTKGQQVRGKHLSIKYIDNTRRKNSRVAIIVSKKVFKHAVDRNTIRRRVYEIMRLHLPLFSKVIDVAVIIYLPDIMELSHKDLELEIDHALTKLNLISK